MQETQEMPAPPLGLGDPLEEGRATHSSILAWRIPTDRGAWQVILCWHHFTGVGKQPFSASVPFCLSVPQRGVRNNWGLDRCWWLCHLVRIAPDHLGTWTQMMPIWHVERQRSSPRSFPPSLTPQRAMASHELGYNPGKMRDPHWIRLSFHSMRVWKSN